MRWLLAAAARNREAGMQSDVPETWTNALTEPIPDPEACRYSNCAFGADRSYFDRAIFRHFHDEGDHSGLRKMHRIDPLTTLFENLALFD